MTPNKNNKFNNNKLLSDNESSCKGNNIAMKRVFYYY